MHWRLSLPDSCLGFWPRWSLTSWTQRSTSPPMSSRCWALHPGPTAGLLRGSDGVAEEYLLRLSTAIEYARKQGNLKRAASLPAPEPDRSHDGGDQGERNVGGHGQGDGACGCLRNAAPGSTPQRLWEWEQGQTGQGLDHHSTGQPLFSPGAANAEESRRRKGASSLPIQLRSSSRQRLNTWRDLWIARSSSLSPGSPRARKSATWLPLCRDLKWRQWICVEPRGTPKCRPPHSGSPFGPLRVTSMRRAGPCTGNGKKPAI